MPTPPTALCITDDDDSREQIDTTQAVALSGVDQSNLRVVRQLEKSTRILTMVNGIQNKNFGMNMVAWLNCNKPKNATKLSLSKPEAGNRDRKPWRNIKILLMVIGARSKNFWTNMVT